MTTAPDFGVSLELNLVEQRIRESLASEEPLLTEIAEYVIASGGKRVRPLVTLLAFKSVGGKSVGRVVDIAAALELIHSASLIHDDINDGGMERRGRPAAYLKFGIQEALVTGDFMFTKAFRIGGKFDDDILDMTARVAAGLAEGEIRPKRHIRGGTLGPEGYLDIITREAAMPVPTGARRRGRVGRLAGRATGPWQRSPGSRTSTQEGRCGPSWSSFFPATCDGGGPCPILSSPERDPRAHPRAGTPPAAGSRFSYSTEG